MTDQDGTGTVPTGIGPTSNFPDVTTPLPPTNEEPTGLLNPMATQADASISHASTALTKTRAGTKSNKKGTTKAARPRYLSPSRYRSPTPEPPPRRRKVKLNAHFAEGWNKLPDELKVHILAYNLTYAKPIHCDMYKEREMLMHHLHLTPEIAMLAKEVYYSTNTFLLEMTFDGRMNFGYPGPGAAVHIRKVIVGVLFYAMQTGTNFQTIGRLFDGSMGFQNVDFLTIKLDWYIPSVIPKHTVGEWVQYFQNEVGDGYDYPVKGRAKLLGIELLHDATKTRDTMVKEVKTFMHSKFRFRLE